MDFEIGFGFAIDKDDTVGWLRLRVGEGLGPKQTLVGTQKPYPLWK